MAAYQPLNNALKCCWLFSSCYWTLRGFPCSERSTVQTLKTGSQLQFKEEAREFGKTRAIQKIWKPFDDGWRDWDSQTQIVVHFQVRRSLLSAFDLKVHFTACSDHFWAQNTWTEPQNNTLLLFVCPLRISLRFTNVKTILSGVHFKNKHITTIVFN